MDSSLGTSWEGGGRKSAALILFPMGVSPFPLLVKSFCRLPKPVRLVGVSQSPVFYEKAATLSTDTRRTHENGDMEILKSTITSRSMRVVFTISLTAICMTKSDGV